MPKCMHLVPGMTSLNTKKAKVKITKTRMLELKLEHKLHNKKYKHDKSLAHLMVMDFDTYIKWRFGKLKRKPISKGEYKPHSDRQLFELTMKKRSDTDKIPVTISLFVYQLSKLHFFKFVLMMKEHFEEDAFKICYIGISKIHFIFK